MSTFQITQLRGIIREELARRGDPNVAEVTDRLTRCIDLIAEIDDIIHNGDARARTAILKEFKLAWRGLPTLMRKLGHLPSQQELGARRPSRPKPFTWRESDYNPAETLRAYLITTSPGDRRREPSIEHWDSWARAGIVKELSRALAHVRGA